ncbi:MAG: short-chain dehydrogenase, partial [Alphaproteobacteria bacterium]
TVGGGGRPIASFYAALPGVAEPLFARFAPSLMRDRRSAWEPYDDGLYDPTEDGLDEEVYYPMVRQFSALAEVRKHPGIAAGVVAVLAGVGLATLLLNQRTGPTRLATLRGRINPRGWVDAAALRDRMEDLAETVRHGLNEAGERAGEFGDEARHRSQRVLHDARHASRKAMRKHGRKARLYARDAGDYARTHAREGGALLALATIAAAVGAAALDARRPDSKLRGMTRH